MSVDSERRERALFVPYETPLHEDGIEPAPELESDIFQQSGVIKAETPVQGDRRLVRAVANHSNHLTHTARLGGGDERGHEQLAQAGTQTIRTHIDGIFHRVLVCGARAV